MSNTNCYDIVNVYETHSIHGLNNSINTNYKKNDYMNFTNYILVWNVSPWDVFIIGLNSLKIETFSIIDFCMDLSYNETVSYKRGRMNLLFWDIFIERRFCIKVATCLMWDGHKVFDGHLHVFIGQFSKLTINPNL